MKYLKKFENFKLYSYWDLIEHYNLSDEAENKHDIVIDWINYNDEDSIYQLLDTPKYTLVSKIQAYFKHILKESNYANKITTPSEFETSLNNKIKIWRGGGGEYEVDYDINRDWVSFTGDKKGVGTFSKYDGTNATNSFILPKREKYWVIELEIKLNDILLYVPEGFDDEFIINIKDAKKSKLIESN